MGFRLNILGEEMKWLKGLRHFTELPKPFAEITKCGASLYSVANKHNYDVLEAETIPNLKGYAAATSFEQAGYSCGDMQLFEGLLSTRNVLSSFIRPRCFGKDFFCPKRCLMTGSRRYGQKAQSEPNLSRDFLVQLWLADKQMRRSKAKRRRRAAKHANHGEMVFGTQIPPGRWFSGASISEKNSYDEVKPIPKQPPISQSATGILEPTSPEEVQVVPLLARSNLLITRDIEWANLMLGFEQENRYAVVDVCYPQSPVGIIREQSNVIARQLLRLRRPFVAYITDALGNELFKVRRPFWWITSSIYTDINGKEVGVVHRRWHLWKRVYDLYLGNKQFAVVENPGFWNWTFTLKDIDGNVLAQIDRDWRGFGFEIFTDAGQYVIRFGSADTRSINNAAGMIQELDITRPLTLSERAVAVALAVSLDNDYFSRHGGWGIPFIAVGE